MSTQVFRSGFLKSRAPLSSLRPMAQNTSRSLQKRVIVVAGPTAAGKSRLALELARIVGGEIISADSIQVYRGMDIGTAKVSHQVRMQVPHHLIDICDVSEAFHVVALL